ncbi:MULTISPECIES: ATP-grasp domain-containing protein [Bacillaceae]|uniref:Alpha-L-glutamate ligase n=1 Tax=Evansella alkalicola TaxID=745819 RepID=A0ABS6K0C2_9BACI|nr:MULTISPECIES: alpha-L-glutamate ligase [Bacillaceae]MBU9724283.1 alpha-L-glutamate ligase [Bacillus alkalicola]
MTKVFILHENDEWTKPLIDALAELQVPFEDWHLHQGVVPLDEVPPEGIFYNRMSASSHTRGHRYAPELTHATLTWLEGHGRRVLNGRNALQLELSKVAQYEALKRYDVLVPKTTAVMGNEALCIATESFPSPFITKHNRAGKGLGVHKFDSKTSLKEWVVSNKIEPSIDGVMLLQEYISSPTQTITRCEFIGGKFMYAVQVDTSEGFELCPAEACEIGEQFCPTDGSNNSITKPKFEIIENYESPLIEKYEKFLQGEGIYFAGIENITDSDGKVYTYDVNTNTNYNPQAEEKAGIFGMKEAARKLKEELKRHY